MNIGQEIWEVRRQWDLSHDSWWTLFSHVISLTIIRDVLKNLDACERRSCKVPAFVVVMLVIGMNLFTEESISQAFCALIGGMRFLSFDVGTLVCGKSTLCEARYRLGAAPMVELFRRVSRPIATPKTRNAFLFGLRLMGVDGTVEDVADTPENAVAFGRQKGSRGDSAFPQLRNVYLAELGTHVICDAIVRGYQYDERSAAKRLLRSVDNSMLLMWDSGFHSYEMVRLAKQNGVYFLGRVPCSVILDPIESFGDGSYSAKIYPTPSDRDKDENGILIRVVEYTIDDPRRKGHGENHRLITSLMDPVKHPARTLAIEYHQRWEIEIAIDEIDTHQRVHHQRPFRSKKPVGVIQEAYGLLLAHFVIRCFMHQAALTEKLDPDRLSFIDSLRVIRRAIPEFQIVPPQFWPQMNDRLLAEIAQNRLPPRDNRCNPRVVKRKVSKFLLKRSQHKKPEHPSKPFAASVVMLN